MRLTQLEYMGIMELVVHLVKIMKRKLLLALLEKVLEVFGSFVSSSDQYIQKIINFCGGLIYTTALPRQFMHQSITAYRDNSKFK